MTKAPQTRFSSMINWGFLLIGLAMVAYHMVAANILLLGSYENQSIHLVFLFLLVFLNALRQPHSLSTRLVQLSLIVVSVGCAAYVGFNLEHLEEVVGFPDPQDVIVGVVLAALCLEGTRQVWGWTLPVVASIFILYFFFGHNLSGALYHRQFETDYVVSYLSVGLSGIYGTFLSISANQVFLFVVFGSLLSLIKANDVLYELGKLVGRRLQGGPAHTAVISSSLVGMITGASVANVAITGAFTIPYMKRMGYSPALAGAIEATASTGGQLMPPVMGAAAFLMAFFIGVPYAQVMLAGIIPAVLFYMAVIAAVQFVSIKEGINPPRETPDYTVIKRGLPLFIIPIAVITTLLLLRFSANVAAFWAIVTGVMLSFLRQGDKPSIREIADSFANGAMVGAKIGISLCVVGLISQTLITTGLGAKIAGLVELFSDGNLLIALLCTMVIAIILGCGVPPVAAYSLVAIVAVPTLIKMGVTAMSAHFFVFYFAIISAVTPPVALGALAGAGIAGANYMRTSIKAFKLSIAGFVIPYLIVFNPIITLQLENTTRAIGSLVAIPIALITLTASIYGVGLIVMNKWERIGSLVTATLLFAYCLIRQLGSWPWEYVLMLLGLLTFASVVISQCKRRKIEPVGRAQAA
jgi:TRAP transporter 4TM/12TM fusion protein